MATGRRENHREDVAGRANVEDTPELLAYYDELENLDAGALWTVANKIEPWQPKSSSVPVLWRMRICASTCCGPLNWFPPKRPVAASSI
jgi:gentisate 1,2-dioxygenase